MTDLSPGPAEAEGDFVSKQLAKAEHQTIDKGENEIYGGAAQQAEHGGRVVEDDWRAGRGGRRRRQLVVAIVVFAVGRHGDRLGHGVSLGRGRSHDGRGRAGAVVNVWRAVTMPARETSWSPPRRPGWKLRPRAARALRRLACDVAAAAFLPPNTSSNEAELTISHQTRAKHHPASSTTGSPASQPLTPVAMTEPTGAQRDDLISQFCAVTGAGPQQVHSTPPRALQPQEQLLMQLHRPKQPSRPPSGTSLMPSPCSTLRRTRSPRSKTPPHQPPHKLPQATPVPALLVEHQPPPLLSQAHPGLHPADAVSSVVDPVDSEP